MGTIESEPHLTPESTMLSFELPWVATLIAFISNFVVGGAWYALFAKPWMREVGLTEAEIRSEKWPMPAYVVAALGAALQAVVLALVLVGSRASGLLDCLILAALLGVAAAFATGKHHAFSKKTWTLFAIDGGNDLAAFLVMGLVFGLV